MSFDVAIVGSGAVGWSCAWHLLSERPDLSLVVFDPDPMRGASRRGTGGIRAQFGSAIHAAMSLYGIDCFTRIADEIGFEQVGYAIVTADPDCAAQLERAVEFQRAVGVPTQPLSPAEIQLKLPFIRNDDLLLGSWCGIDGVFEPMRLMDYLQSESLNMGALKVADTVLGVSGGRLQTERAEFAACVTVLATGHWSSIWQSSLGLDVPIRPERHQLIGFDAPQGVPGGAPMVVDADSGFHFRRKGPGLVCGFGESQEHPGGSLDAVPEFDYEVLPAFLAAGRHRLPTLTAREPNHAWAGYYAPTPDRHGIIDRVGDVILAAGFGGHGVMHAPATGKAVSELILNGHSSTFDLRPLRLSRFREQDLNPELMVF